MIALLDTGQDLSGCEKEIGCEVGQLLTPLTRYRLQDQMRKWAIDNGAFATFDPISFRSLLAREKDINWPNGVLPRQLKCLFVAVPDVPYSARRTLEVFRKWRPTLYPWPVALVAQNGQEDLDIPWEEIHAIFIGGDDKFKESREVVAIIKAA